MEKCGELEYLHPCLTKVKMDLGYPVFLCKKNSVSSNIFMENVKRIGIMQTLQSCPDNVFKFQLEALKQCIK